MGRQSAVICCAPSCGRRSRYLSWTTASISSGKKMLPRDCGYFPSAASAADRAGDRWDDLRHHRDPRNRVLRRLRSACHLRQTRERCCAAVARRFLLCLPCLARPQKVIHIPRRLLWLAGDGIQTPAWIGVRRARIEKIETLLGTGTERLISGQTLLELRFQSGIGGEHLLGHRFDHVIFDVFGALKNRIEKSPLQK